MKRRSARRAFRPVVQGLEPRLVLSNVGVNVGSNYTDGQPLWVNVRNAFSSWASYSNVYASSPSVTTNATGYPTSSASAFVNLENYPAGNYQLSYTGTATLTFSGVGALAGPITTNSSGVSTGTVVVNHSMGNGSILIMQVSGVSATSTFSNFQLDVPGYGSNPTQVFTNTFLQTLAPFSTIRFLSWDLQQNDTTWATAASSAEFSSTTGNVPWQDIVALGNEAQKNIWINIPTEATASYVQSLAQLIQSELDPNLKVYFEYSNETWNSGGAIYTEVLQAAEANPLVNSTNNEIKVEQQTAYELVTDEKIFDSVFGSEQSMVVPVFSAFNALANYGQAALQFIQQNYGTVSEYVGELAIAPYLNITSQQDVSGLTETQLFADLNQDLTTSELVDITSNESVAKSYGVPLAAYEGGQALAAGSSGLNYSVMAAAQTDPRMYQLYVALMNEWNQNVGSNNLFLAYDLSGGGSDYGFWGLLPSVGSPGSEKYDALVSEIEAPGDANLSGTVDYSDLQTVEAYYGQTGTFWQQGDFNNAGVTNFSDLNLVRQNTNPTSLTLAQFAQMALFGQPSSVVAGTPLEYDAYGETSVSTMPFTASSGPVGVNKSSSGGSLGMDGINYTSGLGMAANSSVSVALGGAYSEFDATLQVPGANTATAVIYQVYGDGKLLYQSPVVTPWQNAVPIAVNVSGVKTLTLDVIGATSNVSGDQSVAWIDPRVLSTLNFGGSTPYQVQWQLSENGKTISSVSAGSFEFANAFDGNFTLSVTITNSQGQTATASEQINNGLVAPSQYYAVPSSNQVELDFAAVSGAVAYDIYRGTSPYASSMVVVASNVTILKYVDTNVTNGTTYYYEIAAVDSAGAVGTPTAVIQAMPAQVATLDPNVGSLPETSKSGTIVLNRSAIPDSPSDGATLPLTWAWSSPIDYGLGDVRKHLLHRFIRRCVQIVHGAHAYRLAGTGRRSGQFCHRGRWQDAVRVGWASRQPARFVDSERGRCQIADAGNDRGWDACRRLWRLAGCVHPRQHRFGVFPGLSRFLDRVAQRESRGWALDDRRNGISAGHRECSLFFADHPAQRCVLNFHGHYWSG